MSLFYSVHATICRHIKNKKENYLNKAFLGIFTACYQTCICLVHSVFLYKQIICLNFLCYSQVVNLWPLYRITRCVFWCGRIGKRTIPAMNDFWPAVNNTFHIDAWREVTNVDGYRVSETPKRQSSGDSRAKLFFNTLVDISHASLKNFITK